MDIYSNDKALRESLYVFFLQCTPSEIREKWQDEFINLGFSRQNYWLKTLQRVSPVGHPNQYTIDDGKQISELLKENYFSKTHQGVFTGILDFSKQTLTMENCIPVVKFEEVLRWRNTTHPIGPLPFVAAYLAYEDMQKNRNRINFAIDPVLSTDNRRLKSILSKGIAENHAHLNGSAPSFMISWTRLMNSPVYEAAEWKKIEHIKGNSLRHAMPNWQEEVLLGAGIRAFLYALLEFGNQENQTPMANKLLGFFKGNYLLPELAEEIPAIINTMRWFEHTYDQELAIDIKDYTLQMPNKYQGAKEAASIIYAGEMRFQYMVFQAIFNRNPLIEPYQELFCSYLALQAQLRRELVENDNRYGLGNFCDYDERKKSFFRGNDKNTQKIIPIMHHLCDERVRAMEVRVVPDEGEEKLKRQIDNIYEIVRDTLKKTTIDGNKIDGILNRLHCVLHFVKYGERLKLKEDNLFSCCRHKQLREGLHKTADGIIRLREHDRATAAHITGIDACNNENNARPEVFAPDFRRLKNHNVTQLSEYLPGLEPLYITYHVGEDFQDVTDGLRAVWEAMTFLEMGRSSRIGHGLVLGIDVDDWYEKKQNRVYLTRQALLDNCVWLLMYLECYGLLNPHLRGELKATITTVYTQIYQTYPECTEPLSIHEYWEAYQLRGDDPEFYEKIEDRTRYIQNLEFQGIVNPYALRDNTATGILYAVRRSKWGAIKLYHRYHFDAQVRLAGSKSVEFHISPLMIEGVKQAQKLMQQHMADKGISIETNPSSNVLIGNFNRYEKHPIFSLNDMGLFDKDSTPNISVSINTDDQGIFDTNLENEYALITCALEKRVDSDGQATADRDDIYKWIDHVRDMGLGQSFLQIDRSN